MNMYLKVFAVAGCVFLIGLLAARASRRALFDEHQVAAAKLEHPLYISEKPGASPRLVFLHGLTGSSRYWNLVLANLELPNSTIAIDLLGFGRSPWPEIDYTIDEHLDTLKKTLDQILQPKETVIIVGHSMGAILGLHYAHRFPESVQGLVMLAPPIYDNEQELKANLAKSSVMISAMTTNAIIAPFFCYLHETIGPGITGLFRPFMRGLPEDVQDDVGLHTWRSMNSSLKNVVIGTDFEKLFSGISKVPILAVEGDTDIHARQGAIQSFQSRGYFKSIKVSGSHDFPVTLSAETARVISSFVRSVDGSKQLR